MGDEIRIDHFSKEDKERFRQGLNKETELLEEWIRGYRFDNQTYKVGFEVEAWLIDLDCHPLPHNEAYLERIDSPLCLPELSRFNVEFNTEPQPVGSSMLSLLQRQLNDSWRHASKVAEDMDLHLGIIGILPTVQESDLTLESISLMKRYRALNERVMELRKGRPIQIDIRGRDHLYSLHEDVMLESGCTSFQVHLQVPQSRAVDAYNASIVFSAATVGVSGNAPFLFGMDLWDETRIPLFEQAISLPGMATGTKRKIGRVSCGSGYAQQSLFEFFAENQNAFPVILPQAFDTPTEEFSHLRLHNGTIWRWTRPLVGMEGGDPHLRIEHRVMAAGPTEVDMIANVAFFTGLMMAVLEGGEVCHRGIPFVVARDNFYRAARAGLDAKVVWSDDGEYKLRDLILENLLPMARNGLRLGGIDQAEADHYLDIIEARVERGMTGARWMRAWHYAFDGNLESMVGAYLTRQQRGEPVHRWQL